MEGLQRCPEKHRVQYARLYSDRGVKSYFADQSFQYKYNIYRPKMEGAGCPHPSSQLINQAGHGQ